MYITIFYCFI